MQATILITALAMFGAEQPTGNAAEIKKEMTAEQVMALANKPDRISRQIVLRRHIELWYYDRLSICVQFVGRAGDDLRVFGVVGTGSFP